MPYEHHHDVRAIEGSLERIQIELWMFVQVRFDDS